MTPSPLALKKLRDLERDFESPVSPPPDDAAHLQPALDFTGNAMAVRAVVEGERLTYGHLHNPLFGTETSRIDPLPHQHIAVYQCLLPQTRLRFLLADDAGAGKTIMTGLYIKEMLSRRLLRRVLIVPPAGLVGNWRSELSVLFGLEFRIVMGEDTAASQPNPFAPCVGDFVICSVDTLRQERPFARLQQREVLPYDLVIFDEAHKLSATRDATLRVRKSKRYLLAEALAGIPSRDERWRLPWHARHFLLLTATPHMGKHFPYYALWRLLEPQVLSTYDAFQSFPPVERQRRFIRRTKEEMVKLDGSPLYPQRTTDTLTYDLTQGDISEQALYDGTTDYLRTLYNRARMLNRSAARLALGVFQRRLASSTYALLRSLERRLAKLDQLVSDILKGKITLEQLLELQRRRPEEEEDPFELMTADEEQPKGGREENEVAEEIPLASVIATSVEDLLKERDKVRELIEVARKVDDSGQESKFERLREIIVDPSYSKEKLLIFTEHRDTAEFLIRRLSGMGYAQQIAMIHGGLDYTERTAQVARFRTPAEQGGSRFMVCTDAAGEGINLQFCWVMVNYDIPWNPARLEQRMGRIHRYGQKKDKVIIVNLVSSGTREGKVLHVLLQKMEAIRKQLHSEKVFDVIGRVFEGVSIGRYMEMELLGTGAGVAELEGRLTPEQVEAIVQRERALYGEGGDVRKLLPSLRAELDRETYRHLLPGYVRHYLEISAPLLGLRIEGSLEGHFQIAAATPGALDPFLPLLEEASTDGPCSFNLRPPTNGTEAVWFHPGSPFFELWHAVVLTRLGSHARRGAVFVDTSGSGPYLLHVALVSIVRRPDPETASLNQTAPVEIRLVAIRQRGPGDIEVIPAEQLLLLHPPQGLPADARRLAVIAPSSVEEARAYLIERVARERAEVRRRELESSLSVRGAFLERGFSFEEAELVASRSILSRKARDGNAAAARELDRVKTQQRELAARREEALRALEDEPKLIGFGEVRFVAHALVATSSAPEDIKRQDAETEAIAVQLVMARERAAGAEVKDVHTPAFARAAGLPDYPGFDVLSRRTSGDVRAIEVKGRAGIGPVEISANEWAAACNRRDGYWLYVVFNCASPMPEAYAVQDPFGKLLARARGGMVLEATSILQSGERLA